MNYYEEIKNKIIDNETYERVKDYSKERHRVITYFEIGKLLNEAGSKYGDNIINEYSKKLIIEVGKKYTRSTLFRMKQFYNLFNNEKVAPLVRQLSWSHCLLLIPLKNNDKILYYANEIIKNNLSKRALETKIKSKEYERLPNEAKEKLISDEACELTELKKEHIVQIRIYMNYIDMNLRKFNQDKTIGIILCKKENDYIIEYCSDNRIIERKYAVVGGTK